MFSSSAVHRSTCNSRRVHKPSLEFQGNYVCLSFGSLKNCLLNWRGKKKKNRCLEASGEVARGKESFQADNYRCKGRKLSSI